MSTLFPLTTADWGTPLRRGLFAIAATVAVPVAIVLTVTGAVSSTWATLARIWGPAQPALPAVAPAKALPAAVAVVKAIPAPVVITPASAAPAKARKARAVVAKAERAQQLQQQGLSRQAIARELGVSASTVRRYLAAA